jgi:hypothetical protein
MAYSNMYSIPRNAHVPYAAKQSAWRIVFLVQVYGRLVCRALQRFKVCPSASLQATITQPHFARCYTASYLVFTTTSPQVK